MKDNNFVTFEGPYQTEVHVVPEEVAVVRVTPYNTAIVLKSGTVVYVRNTVSDVKAIVTAAVNLRRAK